MTTLSPYSLPQNPSEVSTSDLNLLAQQFDQQTISRTRPQSYYSSSSPSQQAQSYPNSYSYQPSYSQTYPCRHHADSVRYQRQATARLQTQSSHAQEISSLVDIMAQSGEQCSICPPPPRQHTYPPLQQQVPMDEDEGFDEPEEYQTQSDYATSLSYRRSTDFSNLEGRVARPIRIRKRAKNRESEHSNASSSSGS